MKKLLLLALVFGSINANAEINEFKLPTAEDGVIGFNINADTKLPVGAADDKTQVITAALVFLPKKPGEPLQWSWKYELKFKPSTIVKSVKVEDEKGEQLQLLIKDESPSLQEDIWTGFEQPKEFSKGMFDAMNSKEVWMLLRKMTVTYGDNVQSKLHQMVIQTQPMRVELLEKTLAALKGDKR
jgi:hypothetical protein